MARRSLILSMPTEVEQDQHTFLHYRAIEADAKTKKERARDRIKSLLTHKDAAGKFVYGEEDENGNRFFPTTIAGKRVVAQKKTAAPVIDLERAEALLREKGGQQLYDLVFKREVVRVFSEDDLFLLNQQGVISDEELDALEVTADPTYALVVVDAE